MQKALSPPPVNLTRKPRKTSYLFVIYENNKVGITPAILLIAFTFTIEVPMKITTERSDHNENIIYVSGEFDALGCQKTKKVWHALASNQQQTQIVLDLSRVTFLDSSGVGAIVFLFKKLRLEGKDLVITGVTGQAKDLLTLLRIDQAIAVFTSITAFNALTERES